jgi:3-ketosteroid 9alpha-monooxygenase subunit B
VPESTPALAGARSPRSLVVSRVIRETPDASSFALRIPAEDEALRQYRPGQYLTVRVPSELTGSVARCYSLASSPHHDDELIVTVKRTSDGYASNWLCDNVSEGGLLTVLPPSGKFTPASLNADLVLFAGGSGITPIYSILRSVLSEGSGQVTLFYANRNETSVIFASHLAELARAHPQRLELIHWLESVQGIPGAGVIEHLARRLAGRDAFVCGPNAFMSGVVAALEAAGMPRAHIHKEVYTSLSGNPFDADTTAATEDEPDVDQTDDDGVPTEVDLDGETHTLRWPRTKSLVDVLLAKGVDVPYMCRDGECGSCQAIIESGEINMMRNDILDEEDVADGYLLTCQALPQGDGPIRIVF